jgi:hypothetical protein
MIVLLLSDLVSAIVVGDCVHALLLRWWLCYLFGRYLKIPRAATKY